MKQWSILCLGILLVAGCGSNGMSPDGAPPMSTSPGPGPGGLGATQGGIQDMSLARELIANGVVPPPEALIVEGMFSVHDLPLTGDDCTSALCVRGALGWQETAGWVQLGLSSSIDPATYERPSSALVLLVDVSGSMGWNYGEYGPPARITHDLLLDLVERLDAQDMVGIATFASNARLVQEFIAGDQHEQLRTRINSLAAGGSTNMEAGLLLTREMFATASAEFEVDQRRVLLLTDAQPNVGATGPGSFMELAGSLAEDDIGLTVIGTGIGLDPAVLQAMVNLTGGNGFSLSTAGQVTEFMADNWPWMISPIAYDLRFEVTPAGGFTMGAGFGFPGDGSSLEVETVFLSQRRGALLLCLEDGEFEQLGTDLDLSYTAVTGEPIHQTMHLNLPAGAVLDETGRYFEQYSARKTTALAILVSDMRRAATSYRDERELAISIMQRAAERFSADAQALIDAGQGDKQDIKREAELANRLLALMLAGAEQGTMYGHSLP